MENKEVYVLCEVNGNQEKRPLNFSHDDSRLIDISCTEDSDTGTLTTNIQAGQLWNAASQGMLARLHISYSGDNYSTVIVPIECEEASFNSVTTYGFKFRSSISTPYDSYYYAEGLSPDSTVILYPKG